MDTLDYIGRYDLLEIVMLEVKSGNPSLTKIEKVVKEGVDNQRVRFETLKIQADTSNVVDNETTTSY